MNLAAEELKKQREIYFRDPHPDPRQAHSAALVLTDMAGVLAAEPFSLLALRVIYDVRCITLRNIEHRLLEVGYHLDNSLFSKLRRTVWYYAEETQQANMGCEHGNSNCTRRIFVAHYTRRAHGCRDERPRHWRHYL